MLNREETLAYIKDVDPEFFTLMEEAEELSEGEVMMESSSVPSSQRYYTIKGHRGLCNADFAKAWLITTIKSYANRR